MELRDNVMCLVSISLSASLRSAKTSIIAAPVHQCLRAYAALGCPFEIPGWLSWAIIERLPSLLPGAVLAGSFYSYSDSLRNLGQHEGESLPVAEMAGIKEMASKFPLPPHVMQS